MEINITPVSGWKDSRGVFHGTRQKAMEAEAVYKQLESLRLFEDWLNDNLHVHGSFWGRKKTFKCIDSRDFYFRSVNQLRDIALIIDKARELNVI